MIQKASQPTVSNRLVCIVIPVHNEADNLKALTDRLLAVALRLDNWDMEVLFVDDGSTDDSVQRLREIRASGIPIGFLRLSKNSGHQPALSAGLEEAPGDAVVVMDADLQHPPEEIPRMLQAHESGADVVHMVRCNPRNGSKGFFSRGFYWTFNRLSRTRVVPSAPDFRLIGRNVLDVLLRIPEREKFLRGLIPSLGFHQVALEFDEAERLHGTPAYSFRTSLRLAGKVLFDYSTVPLQFVFWLGTTMSLVSFLFGTGHFVWKLLNWNRVVPGFTDIITAIFFLSGCILASLGIVGHYLSMILEQVRGRPPFVVMDRVHGTAIATPPIAKCSSGERDSIAANP